MKAIEYECGCLATLVGQFFEHGVLVCPTHRKPVAASEKPPQPWRGRGRIVLQLETETLDDATALVAEVCEQVLQDDRVRGLLSTVDAAA